MENATMYKLWLHDDVPEEAEVIKILEDYGRGRSKLIALALQDLIQRYGLSGKNRETLQKFVNDFDFIRDFTAGLTMRNGASYPPPVEAVSQKTEEEVEKEEDKKAYDDLLSAFGVNSF